MAHQTQRWACPPARADALHHRRIYKVSLVAVAQNSMGGVLSAGLRFDGWFHRGKNVLLIFYLGAECPHCMAQLIAVKKRINDFLLNNTVVLAISSATLKKQSASNVLGNLGFRLLSDKAHANARRFHSYDDFEDMELHSTILIDGRGRVRWARNGGDPFMDLDFLVSEIKRVNDMP